MNRNFFLSAIAVLGSSMLTGCSGAAAAPTEESDAQETEALSTEFCPAGVPTSLTPGADQTIQSHFTGTGVQIYMCNATATGFAWTFVAPQANLTNAEGRLVGTHFIGPTWQGNDASAVVGAKVAGVTVDATAVPWLLLTATSHSGDGRFSEVTSIQRLGTVGGIAPSTVCDATKLGAIAQVPYTAEYVFYKTTDRAKVKQCAGG